MLRVRSAGLLLVCSTLVFGCAPRAAVASAPMLEVAVHPVEGRPLATREPEPREDGRSEGDLVEVEWHGSWWPAVLAERRGERWLVHYDGYENEWDEVVTIERVRDRRPVPAELPIEPMDEDLDP